MPRYALILAYDGTDFTGFWRQPGRRTVGGEIDSALGRLGEGGSVVGASRTDAGVHARGQVAHVDLRRSWDPEELTSAVDHQLPPDCACLGARPVTADFHAAHDALSKTYTYRLDRSQPRNPLLARHSWRPPCTWNGELLHAAAQPLVGSHDMRALARSGDHREDFRVSISAASWAIDAQAATFTITANRFVWRLVRSLVGAQVHVASGAASIDELIAALDGTANGVARQQAPARGLCLESIDYGRAP